MRCGSVVTNLKLKPTKHSYEYHYQNCLYLTSGKCGECIKRCPVGAISKNGHDKYKCRTFTDGAAENYVLKNYGIDVSCCGLCQTGVPCESGIPSNQ